MMAANEIKKEKCSALEDTKAVVKIEDDIAGSVDNEFEKVTEVSCKRRRTSVSNSWKPKLESVAIKKEASPIVNTECNDVIKTAKSNSNEANTSNEPLVKTRVVRQKYKVKKQFPCSICNRLFSQKYNMLEHVRVHTGEKCFTCNVCNKCFSRSSNLSVHMRVHAGDRPFICDICGKSFAQKQVLLRHMRTHTGEKPYICGICNECFTHRVSMTEHMQVHTGEKRYNCNVCNKSFTRGYNLLTHMRIHTGEKPFNCDVCSKTFTQKQNLTVHIARIHKKASDLWSL